MTNASVLVVEDNPLSRATAVSMLYGLDAYDGHHALALPELRPEIRPAFNDLRMPGISGLALAALVQQRRPDIKLVLTSGYVGEEAVPSGLDFVAKPWRLDQVARVMADTRSKPRLRDCDAKSARRRQVRRTGADVMGRRPDAGRA